MINGQWLMINLLLFTAHCSLFTDLCSLFIAKELLLVICHL